MSDPTHYDVLKVRTDATPAQIASAYKKLCRIYHPDMNPNDPTATDKMARINASYDVLSDGDRRRDYDMEMGLNKFATPPPTPAPTRAPRAPAQEFSEEGPHFFDASEPFPDEPPPTARPKKKKRPQISEEEQDRRAAQQLLNDWLNRALAIIFVLAFVLYSVAGARWDCQSRGTFMGWFFARHCRGLYTSYHSYHY